MKRNIQNTFLSNSPITHLDGEKYLVIETCNRTTEMLVLRLTEKGVSISHPQAFHYWNGVFTPVNLDTARTDGCYFADGVIHNWIAGETP